MRLLPSNKILVFAENYMSIYDIPDPENVLARSENLGLDYTPCHVLPLPGTTLTRGGPSRLHLDSTNVVRLVVGTDVGIYGVILSPATDFAPFFHLLHVLVGGEKLKNPAISLGIRRAFVRYRNYAVALCYNPDWAGHPAEPSASATSILRRTIPQASLVAARPGMDESSGRVVMANSTGSLTVFYYSLYDRQK